MTVAELIETLEGMCGNTEVRFASQASWPFEYSIDSIAIVANEEKKDNGDDPEIIVYLVEGEQIGYLPGNVRDNIGW